MTTGLPALVGWRQGRLHEYYKEHQDLLSGILRRCNWDRIGYRAPKPIVYNIDEIIIDEEEHAQYVAAVHQENMAVASIRDRAQPAMTPEQWLAFQLRQQAAAEARELARQEKQRIKNRKKRVRQHAKQRAYQQAGTRVSKKQYTENRRARELDIVEHEATAVDYSMNDEAPAATSAESHSTSIIDDRQMINYEDA